MLVASSADTGILPIQGGAGKLRFNPHVTDIMFALVTSLDLDTLNGNQELNAFFVQSKPMIDVRAPVEFAKGAFPSASNLPLLDDQEREAVGTCYKESGHDEAVKLGHRLVSGEKKSKRISRWVSFIEQNDTALLYCFRGGQRSQLACEWLRAEGFPIERIEGGYKRMRTHLLNVFESLPPVLIMSGKTGSGKTQVIEHFEAMIDLEGLAHHRGSAFGAHLEPQPSQIDFENRTAIAFLKCQFDRLAHDDQKPVVLEDESRLIGRISMPLPLQTSMKAAPIMVLEETLEHRVGNIHNEYIVEQWRSYQERFGTDAGEHFSNYLLKAIDAIKKRLGGVAHAEIRQWMITAMAALIERNDPSQHRQWIERLLTDYYDPMYEYQLSQKQDRVQIVGNAAALRAWYQDRYEGEIGAPVQET
ncbi:MAG: tRNA 2-selenouridine synthase [Candidatus Azotimanducaceae bacterium]|jgi:tRNA 2-selenouridine synthase